MATYPAGGPEPVAMIGATDISALLDTQSEQEERLGNAIGAAGHRCQ